jgi:OmcA/MtrC family decaheme c-type cytochrome
MDNGDGTYVYTFYRDVPGIKNAVAALDAGTSNKDDLGDLTYEPSLVHRLTIQLAGNAPGTGSNTPTGVTNVPGVPLERPVDAIYDFTPSTGQAVTTSGRDMVTTANCNTCHQVLGGIPGDDPEASGAGFHGGSRNEVRYCVVCHTDQRKFGRTNSTFDSNFTFPLLPDGGVASTYRVYDRALGNLPNEIHHIHAGPLLRLKQYNYGGVEFNEVLYPQDLRTAPSVTTLQRFDPQADNYRKVPSRVACGGCHDGIDFATGTGVTRGSLEGHVGGIQPDDTECAGCHTDPARPDAYIDTVHIPVTPPNPGNSPFGRDEQQHQRGLDRLQPGAEAGRGDHGHLRRQERLGERAAAAGHGVPDAAGRSAEGPQRLRDRDGQSGDRSEGGLGQLHGRAQPLLRVRGAAGRIEDPGGLQRHRQRLPEDHLERQRDR